MVLAWKFSMALIVAILIATVFGAPNALAIAPILVLVTVSGLGLLAAVLS
jgi:hypothetical protein